MESVKEFLETSSINGISLISSTRGLAKLFWIFVVIGGVSLSIFMIFESFENWEKNPISTTSESIPIHDITFPNVTVCPPKNVFLNLNYDLKNSEKVTLTKNLRDDLLDFALDVIQYEYYEELMANLSKLEDKDRYYNWYHGFTRVVYPIYNTRYRRLDFFLGKGPFEIKKIFNITTLG